MSRRLCLVLLTSVCSFAAVAGPYASASRNPVSPPISFLVLVFDTSGRPVADLSQSDFTVWDNNAVRPIEAFQVERLHRPAPLSLAAQPAPRRSNTLDGLTWYRVEFYPPQPSRSGIHHRVEIQIHRPDLKIFTRQGYTEP